MSDTSENRDNNTSPPKEHLGAAAQPAQPNADQPKPPPQDGTEEYKSGYRDGFKDANQTKKEGEDKEGGDDKKEGGEGQDKKEGGDKKEDGKEGDKKEDGKEGDDKKKKGFHPSPLAIIIVLAVLVLLIVVGLLWWHHAKTHVSTDDAYTTGHVHQMSPRVSGQVIELNVDDNQRVHTGDQLIKLDTRDYEVALERSQANYTQAQAQILQARAAIAQAHANVQQADAGVAQARAQETQAGASYEVAGINYGRSSSLYGKDLRAVSKSDVDTNKSNLDATKAAFNAATANVQSAEANAAASRAMAESREAELKVAEAQMVTAQAGVDDAKLQLSYCWVLAPCDGRVSRRTVEVGQRLSAGQAIMAVTENDVWVLANLKETQLQNVRVGMRCKLPIDAFPDHTFMGYVDSIQNGSGATYSLLPPDNATGNFTKIVQRVPVKLTFDADSMKGYEDLVVPGLSVVPVIDLTTASNQGENTVHGDPAAPKGPNEGKKK